jgi:bifunctional ADP-heptose synthase (sugar kinase/adenylyltransferase)
LDTRNKIIRVEEAAALAGGEKRITVVTGSFDVLLAGHIRELDDARASDPDALLLVAVVAPEHPLVEARGRAEMVAALAMVDYVVSLEDHEMERFLAAFREERMVRLEAAHKQRLRELKEHVERRQSG